MADLPSPGQPPESPRTGTMGGGIFMAIGPILGAVIGGRLGQPVIGLLAGFGLGTLLALLVWRWGK